VCRVDREGVSGRDKNREMVDSMKEVRLYVFSSLKALASLGARKSEGTPISLGIGTFSLSFRV
jgi:hypothetical protein